MRSVGNIAFSLLLGVFSFVGLALGVFIAKTFDLQVPPSGLLGMLIASLLGLLIIWFFPSKR